MSPLDIVEMKQSLAGMAELLFAYQADLVKQGFTEEQSLRIVIAWQTQILRGQTGGEGEAA